MGFVQKRDEEDKEYLDGVEVIISGEGADDDETVLIDIAEGPSAEDLSGTTARREAEGALETEPDPELLAEDEGWDGEFYEDADAADGADDADEAAADDNAADDDEADDPADEAADEDDDPAGDEDFYEEDEVYDESPAGLLKTTAGKIYLAVSVVAVVIAVIVGYFIGNGVQTSSNGVSSYLTEDELSTVVATWTYDGTEYSVTAQEAIESQYSLETVVEDDGTYAAPTADVILSYVQNQILLRAAEDEGISLTEDEVAEYAEDTLGSSDYEYISETYGVTEDQAEEIVTQMAMIQALYTSVIPEISATYPEEPDEPEDGEEDTATAEYAAYIIELAGDEWDSETGTWASTDGDFYAALGEEDITADSATYSQALTAWYVAYTQYYEAYTEASSVWTVYANELYGAADLTLYGLYS